MKKQKRCASLSSFAASFFYLAGTAHVFINHRIACVKDGRRSGDGHVQLIFNVEIDS